MPTSNQITGIERAAYAEQAQQWSQEDLDSVVAYATSGQSINEDILRSRIESVAHNSRYRGVWETLANKAHPYKERS